MKKCTHARQWTIDPKDGLVAERCWCRDCGETLWIRLLYPPEDHQLLFDVLTEDEELDAALADAVNRDK